VIARHYLDALGAAGEDPEVGPIRGEALQMSVLAERVERAGALGRAAASDATAAELDRDQEGAERQVLLRHRQIRTPRARDELPRPRELE
jgi:hypothetical protein